MLHQKHSPTTFSSKPLMSPRKLFALKKILQKTFFIRMFFTNNFFSQKKTFSSKTYFTKQLFKQQQNFFFSRKNFNLNFFFLKGIFFTKKNLFFERKIISQKKIALETLSYFLRKFFTNKKWNYNCEKTHKLKIWQLKKSNCDKTETENVTTQKLKCDQSQIVRKHKKSSFDKTKNSDCYQTQNWNCE